MVFFSAWGVTLSSHVASAGTSRWIEKIFGLKFGTSFEKSCNMGLLSIELSKLFY
jgi:hypothetical protein